MALSSIIYRIMGEPAEVKEFRQATRQKLAELKQAAEAAESRAAAADMRAAMAEAKAEAAEQLVSQNRRKWFSLMDGVCVEIERMRERRRSMNQGADMTAANAAFMLEAIDSRLRDAMVKSGAERLVGKGRFDLLLHEHVEERCEAPEGAPVSRTVESGICVGERVFIRALVETK